MTRKRSAVMLTTDPIVDRRILLEAESLEAAGWDVTIVAPFGREGMNPPNVTMPEAAGPRPARRQAMRSIYRLVRDGVPGGKGIARKAREIGWGLLIDPDAFYRNVFSRHLDGLTPDVFVAHDLPTLPAAHWAARRTKARLIYDSHEFYTEQEFGGLEKRRWRKIENRYIRDCDAVVTINTSIAAELSKRYELDTVEVVHNAENRYSGVIKTGHFHAAFGLPESAKILLLQGGLSRGRNIETLVGAMTHVRNPDIHLVIMGNGPLRGQLSDLIHRQGTGGRVHLHDRVPQSELLSHTAAAHVGVIPYQATSLNNYYCTPNKLFEFIAVGLPVLASDLPEIRRIVDTWQIGLIDKLDHKIGTAAAIDAMFSDGTRLAAWRERASVAGETVNWQREGARFVETVERALAGRS